MAAGFASTTRPSTSAASTPESTERSDVAGHREKASARGSLAPQPGLGLLQRVGQVRGEHGDDGETGAGDQDLEGERGRPERRRQQPEARRLQEAEGDRLRHRRVDHECATRHRESAAQPEHQCSPSPTAIRNRNAKGDESPTREVDQRRDDDHVSAQLQRTVGPRGYLQEPQDDPEQRQHVGQAGRADQRRDGQQLLGDALHQEGADQQRGNRDQAEADQPLRDPRRRQREGFQASLGRGPARRGPSSSDLRDQVEHRQVHRDHDAADDHAEEEDHDRLDQLHHARRPPMSTSSS